MIDKRFTIILKSMEYTDWKDNDARLVKAIPFILTYKRNIHLAIPLTVGNNTEFFKNVAVPTVVNPSHITYIYHFENYDDIAKFKNALKYILNYLSEKDIDAKLNFLLSYVTDAELAEAMEKLKTELRKNDLTQKVVLVESVDKDAIGEDIARKLDENFQIDALERNSTYPLQAAGIFKSHPHYSFDINKKQFSDIVGCEYLTYIHAGQYMKVSDMFASKNSKGIVETPVAFYHDYERLWKRLYRGQESIWKELCKTLSNYHEQHPLFSVNRSVLREKGQIRKHRYLIPADSFVGAKKLIDFLVGEKVFEPNSAVYYYTPDSCEIIIFASELLNENIADMFADPDFLAHDERLLTTDTPYEVKVSYNSLSVSSLNLSNTVAVCVYEALRQTGFPGLMGTGEMAEG